MRPLKVEKAKVDELIPYVNNAKVHTDSQIQQIANSIMEFGNCDPIAVWTNEDGGLEVVEGHGRLLALKELNLQECQIIKLDHLTDEQRRAYTHVHNQLTMNTGWDFDTLNKDIEELNINFDFSDFGFEKAAKIDWESVDEITESNYEKPEQKKIRCPKCGNVDTAMRFVEVKE